MPRDPPQTPLQSVVPLARLCYDSTIAPDSANDDPTHRLGTPRTSSDLQRIVSEQLLATFWTDQDDGRVAELVAIAGERPLTACEQAEIAAYERLRQLLSNLKSRARSTATVANIS
jgi:predicted nucleic acid-binding Zn ribbon protein